MKSILFSWIGFTDLKASRGEKKVGLGPIAQAVSERSFQEIILIYVKIKKIKIGKAMIEKKLKISSKL